MLSLPVWAPNIHPMLIHFPIVLLMVAVLFELLTLIWSGKKWFHSSALIFYGIGTVALIVVYFSGRQAADSVQVADSVYSAISEHANLALRSIWFWIAFVVVRFMLLFRQFDRKSWVLLSLFIVGIIGNYFVYKTAEHGAELVYKYAVGVKLSHVDKPKSFPASVDSLEQDNLTRWEDGSIQWEMREDAVWILKKMLSWDSGNIHRVLTTVSRDDKNEPALSFNLQNSQTWFTFPEKFDNVSVEVSLNPDQFKGQVFITHHFADTLNFDFLLIENSTMSLGRLEGGKRKVLDTKPIHLKGWNTLKVVVTKGHFRGYLNDKLIVHGHGKDLPPGQVGVFFNGTGELFFKKIVVKPL